MAAQLIAYVPPVSTNLQWVGLTQHTHDGKSSSQSYCGYVRTFPCGTRLSFPQWTGSYLGRPCLFPHSFNLLTTRWHSYFYLLLSFGLKNLVLLFRRVVETGLSGWRVLLQRILHILSQWQLHRSVQTKICWTSQQQEQLKYNLIHQSEFNHVKIISLLKMVLLWLISEVRPRLGQKLIQVRPF